MHLKGKALLIGYGNPGRLDDGLGPQLADRALAWQLADLTVENVYQLAVEHAEQAAGFEVVLFADASVNGPEPFELKRIEPQMTIAFSTHHVSPETILGLAQSVFGSSVAGYTMAIRGYQFDDFGERLSNRAKVNLDAAARYLYEALRRNIGTESENLATGIDIR